VSVIPAFHAKAPRSTPGLGGAPLGNLFRALPDHEAIALVRHAFDTGTRYFDTAPHYGHGLSEHRLGAALRGLDRDSFMLSTKVGRLLTPDTSAPSAQHGYVDVLPFVAHYDYTRNGVLRSLEDSLQRLGMARIDFAYVHDLDRATQGAAFPHRFRDMLDGALPALAALRAAGAIEGYGLGVNHVDICLETLRHAELDVILLAGRYTLADQSALPALLPECVRRGVTVVLGGPFNSGILATGSTPADGSMPSFDYAPATDAVRARVAAIERVCAEFAVPLKATALQFPLAHPAIANVLAGARTRLELDENLAMMRLSIPEAFWQVLHERALVDPAAPLPGAQGTQ
jgi:D-threo-aldose 1-dehydrogenase